MRRAVTLLSTAALLSAAFVVPATASAEGPTRVQVTRTGATTSFVEIHDGILVNTELSFNTEATRDGVTTPFVFLNQSAYAPDEAGEYNTLAWYIEGNTTEFTLTIDGQLSSATAHAPAMPVSRCDADFNCVEDTVAVGASFSATGVTQRSHQSSVGSISRQSMFIYHNVGAYRFASAVVTIGGTTYGPSVGVADASIYDTRTGWIDIAKASPLTRATVSGVTIQDTAETPTGRQTGDSMFAQWASEADGVGRNVVLSASTRQVNTKGTFVTRIGVGYGEQVYTVDEYGNITTVSDTYGDFDGTSAATVTLDRALSTGILTGAAIPATSCTYIADEALCIETVVRASGQWTGFGETTKTRDGSSGGVAGVVLIVYHNTSTHRSATATATVDGVTLNESDVVEGWVDRASTGFHEVHLRG